MQRGKDQFELIRRAEGQVEEENLAALQFTGPAPGPGDDTYCALLIGDMAGPQNAVIAEINGSSGGADRALISLVDDLGGRFAVVAPLVFGVNHVVTIVWDGTIHRALVDGVEVVAGLLRDPATITLKYTSLEILRQTVAALWTIHGFAFTAKALPLS